MPADEVCLKYRSQTSVVELRIVIIILTFKRHSTENLHTGLVVGVHNKQLLQK